MVEARSAGRRELDGACALLPSSLTMIWFFARGQESLRVETRYDQNTTEYVAVVRHPDGREHERRFSAIEEFALGLRAIESWLQLEQWTADGPPLFLPHGWPGAGHN
jgi:hypothetical protein